MNSNKKVNVFYSRVSTLDQNDARQLDNLSGFDFVFADKCSGSIPIFDRPKGKQIRKLIDNGQLESLTIHSIDRLGRDTLSVLDVWKQLTEYGIKIICRNPSFQNLNEDGSINIFSDLMLSILSIMGDFEKKLIKERQIEGIEKAKLEGKYTGRVVNSKESVEQFLKKPKIKRIIRDINSGYTVREIAENANCSNTTILKVKKLLLTKPKL
ncbi:recombinase family protein [Belliella sp. DSM 111904]|uniref:Recombinase family protein n=1 Tax=Belliella filtrata TaxID=2923435 RepID=A0ABS9V196_9BACT|nr:recombinase family protein [Belliella filtrata]MCH7410201.1 recombinase family protein [Belliella filtrata]